MAEGVLLESGFTFNFPAWQPKGEVALEDQIKKIQEETIEVRIADMDGDVFLTAMELMDVIHCAETGLRMLGVEKLTLDAARLAVERKNAERGYYKKEN